MFHSTKVNVMGDTSGPFGLKKVKQLPKEHDLVTVGLSDGETSVSMQSTIYEESESPPATPKVVVTEPMLPPPPSLPHTLFVPRNLRWSVRKHVNDTNGGEGPSRTIKSEPERDGGTWGSDQGNQATRGKKGTIYHYTGLRDGDSTITAICPHCGDHTPFTLSLDTKARRCASILCCMTSCCACLVSCLLPCVLCVPCLTYLVPCYACSGCCYPDKAHLRCEHCQSAFHVDLQEPLSQLYHLMITAGHDKLVSKSTKPTKEGKKQ